MQVLHLVREELQRELLPLWELAQLGEQQLGQLGSLVITLVLVLTGYLAGAINAHNKEESLLSSLFV